MKLSEYARRNNLTYTSAFNHWKRGLLKGKQLPTGTIVLEDDQSTEKPGPKGVALYARVSSTENKNNLESQLKRLRDYSSAKGYIIVKEIKEIGSGLNDNRKGLENLLKSDDWDKIIVEHKDRLARFGINYLQVLLEKSGKSIEIINKSEGDKSDLMEDFVSIITSFTARLYGLRRSKRRTERIIESLKNDS